jgi:hypothetical protein
MHAPKIAEKEKKTKVGVLFQCKLCLKSGHIRKSHHDHGKSIYKENKGKYT